MASPLDDVVNQLLGADSPATIEKWEARYELSEDVFARVMWFMNRLVHGDREVAARTVEFLLAKAEQRGNRNWQARLFLCKSYLLVFTGKCRQGLEVCSAAISLLQSLGDEVRVTRARAIRLSIYTRLGLSRLALAEVSELEPLVERLADERTSTVFSLNAALLYLHLDRFEEAVTWSNKAIDLSLQQNDADNVFNTYGNLATSFIALDRIEEALASYAKAIAYADRNGLSRRAAIFLYNRAYLFFMQGRYRDALDALKITRRDLEHEEYDLACIDLAESEIHLESNLFDEAISLAESAGTRFSRLEANYEVAQALTIQGFSHGRLGHDEKAGSLLIEARAMFYEQLNYSRAALVDIFRARLLLESGQASSARRVAQEACEVFDRESLLGKAAYARMLIARCLLVENDLPGAWNATRQGIEMNDRSPRPWLSYQLHYLTGDLYSREGDLASAHREYQEAVRLSEELRSELTREEHRLSFAHDKEMLFESLVRTCFGLQTPDALGQAFHAVEKAKSRTLADLMTNSVSVTCGGALLRDGSEPSTTDSLLRLHENQVASAAPISLQAVQGSLEPDTALIEYFVSNGTVGAFVLRRDSAEVEHELGRLADIQKRADLLDFQFSRFRLGADYVQSHHANLSEIVLRHLRALHATLFQPLERLLAGCRKCIIVPHGVLHRVPFHILTDGDQYVLDKFAVTYAPSATVYGLCASRVRASRQRPLIVGVEDPSIPGVVDEIASLRKQWPEAAVLRNESATFSNFSSQVEGASIVHVATHADFSQDNAMFSSIRLADRWMNVAEIYGLNIGADLVTLSGCGTGLGSLKSGDEMIGLVRGFLYAGARCLLVSLWDVHDGSASELMRRFYEGVHAGLAFAEALRSAMLAMREAQPHPYYWGSFRLVGWAG